MQPRPYILSEWLGHQGLHSYHLVSAGEGEYVVLNGDIADGLIQYLRSAGLVEMYNDNSLMVCLVCGGPFVINGDLCGCNREVTDCHNFHCFVSSEALFDAETVLKKIKLRLKSQRLRQSRAMAPGSYDATDLELIYKLQAGLCYYCMCPVYGSGCDKYSIDHIIPLSSGGTHWPMNIALTCKACNKSKSWKSEKHFIQKARSGKGDEWVQEHKDFLSFIKRHKRKIFASSCGV